MVAADLDSLAGKRVLVAGASGLICSFLVDVLLRWNETHAELSPILVTAMGRSKERLEKRFEGCFSKENLTLLEKDVCDELGFDEVFDVIIHGASNAFPAAFASDPVGTMTANLIGTKQLLELAKKNEKTRFVYISSGEVYGQGDITLDAFEESYSGYVDSTNPRSCYPMSKRAAETLCVSYKKQYGVSAVIVRPCHTYGPNETGADNRAHVQFVNDGLAGRNIVMKSTGTQMRSYCYIADSVAAILTVLLKGEAGSAYNIANEASRCTVADFAKEVAAQSGVEVVFEEPDAAAKAQLSPIAKQVLDTKRLVELGFVGGYAVQKGIEHTLAVKHELVYI